MDEIETLLNNLGEEQMKDILADAARAHPDILDAIKEAGNSFFYDICIRFPPQQKKKILFCKSKILQTNLRVLIYPILT